MFTNASLQQMTGAVSFRRWLGCAPIIVARLSPHRRGSSARATASLIITAERAGWLERRSDLSSAPRPLPRRDLHCGAASRRSELSGRMYVVPRSCLQGVLLKNSVAFSLVAQPNGVRLSCAARVWFSQLQFYYDGRRQLQPLVRLRTNRWSLGSYPAPEPEEHAPVLTQAPPL